MNSKELLAEFGNEVYQGILYDKKAISKNGQLIKLLSQEKDFHLEINFQAVRRGSANYVAIVPHVLLKSKSVKDFELRKFGNKDSEGVIFSEQIGHMSPRKEWKSWDLGESNLKNTALEVVSMANEYVVPFYLKINTADGLYSVMKEKSLAINEYSEPSLKPLMYALANNQLNVATELLTSFLEHKKSALRNNILKLLQKLESDPSIDIQFYEFQDANIVKMAYLMGIRIAGN